MWIEVPSNQKAWEREEKLERIKQYLDALKLKFFRLKKKNITNETENAVKDIFLEDEDRTDVDRDEEQNELPSWGGDKYEDQQQVNDENTEKKDFELPSEDQDEYIPHDSEFWEAMGESSRFAEIYPPFLWYYSKWKKSYFNRETNLWSKKKVLSSFSHKLNKGEKHYTYTWVITEWITAIPLPELAWPDTDSLQSQFKDIPEFKVDQNWCVYLISKKKQFVSFNFWLNQFQNNKAPIQQDSERIVFDQLSHLTQELLRKLKVSWWTTQQIASAIKYYIIENKKYSTKVQWTLRDKSNRNNYIVNLDKSPILECFSANSLFVALCRELWINARLVVWHMVQSTNKEWKACLTKNDWHAWSEIWDPSINSRIRFDATPTQKEDWEESNENWQENQNQWNSQNADNNFWDSSEWWNNNSDKQSSDKQKSWSEWKESKDWENQDSNSDDISNSSKESSEQNENTSQEPSQQQSSSDTQQQDLNDDKWWNIKQQSEIPSKTPWELLDEMIEKAKEEDLIKQADKIKDTLDKLQNSKSKEEMKKTLDESWLSDFAKDMVDSLWNEKILEEEKKEIEKLNDESEIDKTLKNSLLDDEYKEKLKQYAKIMKDKILEEKRKMKNEMEKMWFTEQELWLYKEYKELEKEVEPEVRRQIRELEKILPAKYKIITDESQTYRSGPRIDGSGLVNFVVEGDSKVFRRDKEVRESNEINMFETIIIDTSWSMGSFSTQWSILRESIKAAIIRAKTLEHFKVDFSIVLFWDRIDEVMTFWEKFSSKWKCKIPSKLMRAAHVSWWNSREPISYVYQNMLSQLRKCQWTSFGNISFIWDWDLYNFNQIPQLKAMIDDLKKRKFWVTAYYINQEWRKMPLIEYYFWTPEDWWAVYAWDAADLSKKIIESHRTHLKKKINRFIK